MEKENNFCLRPTAEMLTDEGLVIAVLKQLLQDSLLSYVTASIA